MRLDILTSTSLVGLLVNVLLKVSSLVQDEVRHIHLFNYTSLGDGS